MLSPEKALRKKGCPTWHAGLFVSLLVLVCACAGQSRAGAGVEPTATSNAQAPAPAALSLEGTISTVEPDGTVIVLVAPGKGVVLYVQPGSKVFRNEKPAGIKDLRVGDRASVQYGGGSVIVEIHAKGF
jgi:hypothetical protein